MGGGREAKKSALIHLLLVLLSIRGILKQYCTLLDFSEMTVQFLLKPLSH